MRACHRNFVAQLVHHPNVFGPCHIAGMLGGGGWGGGMLGWILAVSRVHMRISTRFRLYTFQSRFESTSRGGLNPDSFKSYATGSELKSSCERGY